MGFDYSSLAEEVIVPTITVERGRVTAKRQFRVLDGSPAGLTSFLTIAFPPRTNREQVPSDTFPGYPFVYLQKITVEPWDPENLSGTYPPYCPTGQRVTLEYGSRAWDEGPMSAYDTPGGQNPNDHSVSVTENFLSWSTSYGGSFVTVPNNAYSWLDAITLQQGNNQFAVQGWLSTPAGQDVHLGILEGTQSFKLKYSAVYFPPWAAIRRCRGSVNADPFLGGVPGTLLFLGCTGSREIHWNGQRQWELEYSFEERYMGLDRLGYAAGFNHMLHVYQTTPGATNTTIETEYQQLIKSTPNVNLNPDPNDYYYSTLLGNPLRPQGPYPMQSWDGLFTPLGT